MCSDQTCYWSRVYNACDWSHLAHLYFLRPASEECQMEKPKGWQQGQVMLVNSRRLIFKMSGWMECRAMKINNLTKERRNWCVVYVVALISNVTDSYYTHVQIWNLGFMACLFDLILAHRWQLPACAADVQRILPMLRCWCFWNSTWDLREGFWLSLASVNLRQMPYCSQAAFVGRCRFITFRR